MGGRRLRRPAGACDLLHGNASTAAARAEARAARPTDSTEAEWERTHPFADALVADGWTETTGVSACGCGEWTAPGPHGSPKSATLHRADCPEADYAGKLHVWTDNPPSELAAWIGEHGPMVSRLEYEAAAEFDGRLDWARVQLGVPHPDHEGTVAAMQAGAEALGVTPGELGPVYATAQTEYASTGQITVLSAHPAITDVVGEGTAAPVMSVVPDPDADAAPTAADRLAAYVIAALGRSLTDGEADWVAALARVGVEPTAPKYPRGFPSDLRLVRDIMDFSPQTRAIFHTAQRTADPHGGRRVHPIAALMRQLVRVGRRAPVDLRTPTGQPISTYIIAVGKSGSSKTAALRPDTRDRLSLWPDMEYLGEPPRDPEDTPLLAALGDLDATSELGSGEALADLLQDEEEAEVDGKSVRQRVMKAHPSAWIFYDEITSLTRAGTRQGSTVVGALLSAWSGAPIGNTTRTHGNARIDGQDYTCFLAGGLQPELAADYLALDRTGFVQRTVLVPAAWPWGEIDFGLAFDPDTSAPSVTVAPGTRMTACEAVYDALREAELASLAETDDEDLRESHLIAVRIRLASLAALLHDSTHIDESVWQWSGLLMEVHRRTLAWMEAVARDAEQTAAERRGQIRAYERSGERGETASLVDQASEKVMAVLTSAGAAGITPGRLRARVTPRLRSLTRDAIAALVDAGDAVELSGRVYSAAAVRKSG